MFQSTLPHGERRFVSNVYQHRKQFQSTLPHGERRINGGSVVYNIHVSIHAPARGATFAGLSRLPGISCFNPRSRTGSDRRAILCRTLHHRFNPRSRTGSDISVRRKAGSREAFQSTLPHGERRRPVYRSDRQERFQSTLPHGERLDSDMNDADILSFNPRSRTGSDPLGSVDLCEKCGVSIHAPARGATRYDSDRFSANRSFNPRSRTGSDSYVLLFKSFPIRFNPRSRTGSDIFSPSFLPHPP